MTIYLEKVDELAGKWRRYRVWGATRDMAIQLRLMYRKLRAERKQMRHLNMTHGKHTQRARRAR